MAEGGKQMNTVEDLICCQVCLEPYDDPRILSCGHVFCVNCLEKMVDNPGTDEDLVKIVCPTCHGETLVSDSVKALTRDVILSHLRAEVEKLSDTYHTNKESWKEEWMALCETCHERKAEKYCCDCRRKLCTVCIKMHLTQEHPVVNIHGSIYCKTHVRNIVSKFCKTCNTTLCEQCMTFNPDHLHHDLFSIQQYARELREKIELNIISFSNTTLLDKKAINIGKNIKELTEDEEKFKGEANLIKSSLLNLQEEIGCKSESYLQNATETRNKLTQSQKKIQSRVNLMMKSKESLEELRSVSSDFELISRSYEELDSILTSMSELDVFDEGPVSSNTTWNDIIQISRRWAQNPTGNTNSIQHLQKDASTQTQKQEEKISLQVTFNSMLLLMLSIGIALAAVCLYMYMSKIEEKDIHVYRDISKKVPTSWKLYADIKQETFGLLLDKEKQWIVICVRIKDSHQHRIEVLDYNGTSVNVVHPLEFDCGLFLVAQMTMDTKRKLYLIPCGNKIIFINRTRMNKPDYVHYNENINMLTKDMMLLAVAYDSLEDVYIVTGLSNTGYLLWTISAQSETINLQKSLPTYWGMFVLPWKNHFLSRHYLISGTSKGLTAVNMNNVVTYDGIFPTQLAMYDNYGLIAGDISHRDLRIMRESDVWYNWEKLELNYTFGNPYFVVADESAGILVVGDTKNNTIVIFKAEN